MSLFDPLIQRGARLRNRIVVSPMCEYSACDGVPNDWHLVHLGSRAVGGAAVVFAEATAVTAEGRISPADTGLWNDAQAEAWARIARFVSQQGAIAGIQLAHAGRKAGTAPPWQGGQRLAAAAGGWTPVAPSAIAFRAGDPPPRALDDAGIAGVIAAFAAAATRAVAAGFGIIELHAAHGYLLHEFLSPLSNRREDAWGGDFDQRIRLTLEVVRAVRDVMPDAMPLWIRISATDWAPHGGWEIEHSVRLARELRPLGIDLIDVSSGGTLPNAAIPTGPGYQVPFAARIRHDADIATGAVGEITDPAQADAIIATDQADVVVMARELLRDPYFPRRAAKALGAQIAAPRQYARAW